MDKQLMADTLRHLRGDKPQYKVAKALKISPASYSCYENGTRIPRDDVKIRIANYFGKSVKYIFFGGSAYFK